jgi:hypothetical protein
VANLGDLHYSRPTPVVDIAQWVTRCARLADLSFGTR